MISKKIYLGDAVYARWIDNQIELTTSDGFKNTNVIFLDEDIMRALTLFLEASPIEEDPNAKS